MIRAVYRITAIILCCCIVFEQSGYAQVCSAQGFAALPSVSVRPPELRACSYDRMTDSLSFSAERGDFLSSDRDEVARHTARLFRYFRIGLTIPSDAYWVNLQPDAEDRIMDADLAKTDAGKIMLAADLQLKKDLARLLSPDTATGRKYWQTIDKNAAVLFPGWTAAAIGTRIWVVPGEIILGESPDAAYIYKATLDVRAEQDHFNGPVDAKSVSVRALNDIAVFFIKDEVLPLIVKEVNRSEKYAGLRQVYYSLILAQWYKSRFRNRIAKYTESIDTRCLTGLQSQESWNKRYYFDEYRKSLAEGEYNRRETDFSPYGLAVKNYCTGGVILGFDFPGSIPAAGRSISQGPVTVIGRSGLPAGQLRLGDEVMVDDREEAAGRTDGGISSGTSAAADLRTMVISWLRPKFPFLRCFLTAFTAVFIPLFFPLTAYAHSFVQSGARIFAVPAQWTGQDPAQNTLLGIAKDLLVAQGQAAPQYQDMATAAKRIAEVNPSITDWNIIGEGVQYAIPPEYVSDQVIANLQSAHLMSAGTHAVASPAATALPQPAASPADQFFGQIGHGLSQVWHFIVQYPEITSLILLGAVAAGFFLSRFLKQRKENAEAGNDSGSHDWVVRFDKASVPAQQGKKSPLPLDQPASEDIRNTVEQSMAKIGRIVVSITAADRIPERAYTDLRGETLNLRKALMFTENEVNANRSLYRDTFAALMPLLRKALDRIIVELRKPGDGADLFTKAQLKITACELLRMLKSLNLKQDALWQIENVNWAADRLDPGDTVWHRFMNTIVIAINGFDATFKNSANRLNMAINEIIREDVEDGLYDDDSAVVDAVFGNWNSWVENAYKSKRGKYGAKKSWSDLKDVFAAFISITLIAFFPFAAISGMQKILSAFAVSDLLGGANSVVGILKAGLGFYSAVGLAWLALRASQYEPGYKENLRDIDRLEKTLAGIPPVVLDRLKDEGLRIAYGRTMMSLEEELSSSRGSAEAVIVVADDPERVRAFLERSRGIVLRQGVELICIGNGGKGSLMAEIDGYLAARRFNRAVVLLAGGGQGREDMALTPLPLPPCGKIGRPFTPLELALVNGYQDTQVFSERARSGVSIQYTHQCHVRYIKGYVGEKNGMADIEVQTAYVPLEQMEKQKLGLVVINGNGHGGGNLRKLFQGLTQETAMGKFLPKYVSSFIRPRGKRGIPVNAGGKCISIREPRLRDAFDKCLLDIREYMRQHDGVPTGWNKANFTTYILVPLLMIANGEGRDIHRFMETMAWESAQEWKFYDGLLNFFWPHFYNGTYRSEFEALKIEVDVPYETDSLFVRMDRSAYAERILREGLGSLYTPAQDKPRTTIRAKDRRQMIRDYFQAQGKRESTVRGILSAVFSQTETRETLPGYATVYKDLEILVHEGTLIKEKKVDPETKRVRNYYHLSQVGAALAGIESNAPVVSSRDGGTTISLPGGIDFRALPVRGIGTDGTAWQTAGAVPVHRVYGESDFTGRLREIRRKIRGGEVPDTGRLRELYGAAWRQRNRNTALEEVHECIAQIFRIEERMVVPSEPAVKELLALLVSGSAPAVERGG